MIEPSYACLAYTMRIGVFPEKGGSNIRVQIRRKNYLCCLGRWAQRFTSDPSLERTTVKVATAQGGITTKRDSTWGVAGYQQDMAVLRHGRVEK